MVNIKRFEQIQSIGEALSAEIRLDIIGILLKSKKINMQDLSKAINLSSGALTPHIKKLEDAGIVKTHSEPGIRGVQKICTLETNRIFIEFEDYDDCTNNYTFEIDIGQYTAFSVVPTCGIATTEIILGEVDEPRYFAFPARKDAALIWLAEGHLEYQIPNPLRFDEEPIELQLSMELSSEAPGFATHYPSDIHFAINGIHLGFWTSPGEFNDRAGLFTPNWWFANLGQYGRLKLVSVQSSGTYIDGLKISDITIKDLKIDSRSFITLTICNPKDAVNKGGITLFGKGFGDYAQGIRSSIVFKKTNQS